MKYICNILAPLILLSCEKKINFTLHDSPTVLVVDAAIESGKPPIVYLSRSFDYYSQISPAVLANAFVHNADVYISNGILTHKLKEYHVDSLGGFRIYFYSIDSANLATAFVGQFNSNYSIRIVSEGKEYISSTTIPILAKKPDTMFWKKAPSFVDTTKVNVMVRSTDPPGLGNYIRYFTKRNSGPYLPGESSVYDDQIIDGTTYEVKVEPGIDRNNPVKYEDNYFLRGDTVTLKLCNIDRNTFNFWNGMEFAYQSIGNPFSSPNKVIGNVSNGALGVFCGYAVFYKTLIIPK